MFDKRNLIGPTQFGGVYRGKICEGVSGSKTKNVIVKIWDEKSDPLVGKDEYLMVKAPRSSWIFYLLCMSIYVYISMISVLWLVIVCKQCELCHRKR